jgi:hypothetical protein
MGQGKWMALMNCVVDPGGDVKSSGRDATA